MKQWIKRLTVFAPCLALIASLTACGNQNSSTSATDTNSPANTAKEIPATSEGENGADAEAKAEEGAFTIAYEGEEIYLNALGAFYALYEEALEAETLSERSVRMAIAEAK